MKIMLLNNKDTLDANVYAFFRACIRVYTRIKCAYVRIKRVCAVNVYLSGTVNGTLELQNALFLQYKA